MNGAHPTRRRLRRGSGPGCEAGARETGRGTLRATADPGGLITGATTEGLLTLGASLTKDLRDPDGIARPLLRRAALHLSASRLTTARRLGAAYLRADPPTLAELGDAAGQRSLPPAERRSLPAPPRLAAAHEDDDLLVATLRTLRSTRDEGADGHEPDDVALEGAGLPPVWRSLDSAVL
jgi:hypothetical protein